MPKLESSRGSLRLAHGWQKDSGPVRETPRQTISGGAAGKFYSLWGVPGDRVNKTREARSGGAVRVIIETHFVVLEVGVEPTCPVKGAGF